MKNTIIRKVIVTIAVVGLLFNTVVITDTAMAQNVSDITIERKVDCDKKLKELYDKEKKKETRKHSDTSKQVEEEECIEETEKSVDEEKKLYESDIDAITKNVSNHFKRIMENNVEWKDSTIRVKKALFNSDGEINAYIFNVMKDGNRIGYLIADNEENSNIIEYGKELFLDEALNAIDDEYEVEPENQKVYYLGGINYAIGGKDSSNENVYVDITTSDCNEISKADLKTIEKEACTLSSPPDSGDSFITDPSKYESGYDSYKSKNLKNFNIAYKLMTDFSTGGVCAPTAATNFMYYWYNNDKSKYEKLYYNASWKQTYKKIYKYMGTSETSGTKDAKVVTGYKEFLKDVGVNCTASFHEGTSSGKKIVAEIDKNRPCHLMLHNHYRYGNHSVLALGYQQYVYEHWYGDAYEIYIRIVDGWQRYPWRFVWGNCSGNWNYVSVTLK